MEALASASRRLAPPMPDAVAQGRMLNRGVRVLSRSASGAGSHRSAGDTAPGVSFSSSAPGGSLRDATAGLGASILQASANGDVRALVEQLEELQALQRSPQQPNPELDRLLSQALAGHPEWRQRMAVLSKSAWLRKKIVATAVPGGRGVGSAALGSTHSWREDLSHESFTDHNWPEVSVDERGSHLPGGTHGHHAALLRSSSDKVRMHPLLSHSANHSVPKADRFPGTNARGLVDRTKCLKSHSATPAPDAHFKSCPRGTAFAIDGGETVVMGPNHPCPWKRALGRQINPVDVDLTHMQSQPAFSFGKSRRAASEVSLGLAGGSVKSDLGCLSPGPVYEHLASFRPSVSKTAHAGGQRRAKSTPGGVRSYYCPPGPEDMVAEGMA